MPESTDASLPAPEATSVPDSSSTSEVEAPAPDVSSDPDVTDVDVPTDLGTQSSFETLEDATNYITKLNSENASRRVALKPYKDAFGGFDEGAQTQLLGLIQELSNSPETAAHKLITLGNIVLGNSEEDVSEMDDLDRPMTFRQMQEYQSQQESDRAFQAEVQGVFAKARELGYDDNTVEQRTYLAVLANEADGDPEKAHQMVGQLFNRKIKEYIDGKRKQRGESTENPVLGLNTETESHAPKTWKEATNAAVARLNSSVGQ